MPDATVTNTVDCNPPHLSFAFSAPKLACSDTGSTNLLVRQSDASAVIIDPHLQPISVTLPNGSTISSSVSGTLLFPNLPYPIYAYIFPDKVLHTSLLSVSDLCNVGCLATFTDTQFHVTYNNSTVLHGIKATSDTLWTAQLPTQSAAASTHTTSSHAARLTADAEFVLFVHASLGSPVYSTFLRVIRAGYLSSWPRLTTNIVLAHPPHTIATAKCHLNQLRQGLDSTKTDAVCPTTDNDDSPELPLTAESANHTYVKMVRPPHTVSSDLTGKFPVQADSGAQYILISEMDGYIHAEPLASRHHTAYISSFTRTISFFTALGRIPFFLRLDNETSAPLDVFMKRQSIKMQYCPPGMHRSNRAERSIQTFKNHAIATLCTTSKDFPLTLWDRLLPQIELCLNHLHPYKPNPTISAYAGLHGGAHDFRANPIGPAGAKILIHDKPSSRGSWAPHGVAGFYLGPAPQHYRCFTVWSSSTNAVRITDTLVWFLDNLQLPNPSVHDLLLAAIHDLTTAINTITSAHPALHHHRQLSNIPSLTQQLHDIASLYNPPPNVPILPIDAVADPPDATEQRVHIPQAALLTHLTLPAVFQHPLTPTPTTEQRVPVTDSVPSPPSKSQSSNIDNLPNVPLLPSQNPPTVPKPPPRQ